MNKILSFLVLSALILGINACTSQPQSEGITIVTTTGIVGDCVRSIVGDKAEVVSIMGAGVDPHLYKASQGDIGKLSNADIIVYNGLHLEGKMAQMLVNYAQTKPTLAVGDFVPHSALKSVGDGSDLHDPHIWFNPSLWLKGLEGVALALDSMKGLEGTYDRFLEYKKDILLTEQNLRAQLDSQLEVGERILITSHDAFVYFGDAFNFEVRGLQGISTAAEYGARDVKNLIDFVVERNINAVFVETSVSNKNLEAVIEGAQARNHSLEIGGTLYSDALGAEGSGASTYKGMLIANINTILEGLK